MPATIMKEVVEAEISKLKKNKAPGINNVSAEEIQAAGNSGIEIIFKCDARFGKEKNFHRHGRNQLQYTKRSTN